MLLTLPVLFGQATDKAPEAISPWLVAGYMALLFFVSLVLPFLLGHSFAKSLRMPDYGWKIGLVLWAVIASVVVIVPKPERLQGLFPGWPPKLGIDLNGGAILVYKVDLQGSTQASSTSQSDSDRVSAVITALSPRLNPDGLKEIVIRPFGSDHLEIIVPEVDPLEIDQIKKLIATAGILEFLAVAIPEDHADLIAEAQEQAKDPVRARSQKVLLDGKEAGLWVGVERNNLKDGDNTNYKVDVSSRLLRNKLTGEILDVPSTVKGSGSRAEAKLSEWVDSQGIKEVEVLMALSPTERAVTGADLGAISVGFDTNSIRPKVDFSTKNLSSANKMKFLTEGNLSSGGVDRFLGIVLDGRLISAPSIRGVISDQGQITGDFSEAEVTFLVNILRSGSLPETLSKTPESENRIDPLLGKDTIVKGAWSIAMSLVAVLLFMIVYYRFSGLVACFVLVINIVLVVALMILFKAPFTLPGLAGMVLTVGMSVDANVLIYERMREELAKGAALRMTIRNGFDRAFVTILDSNLTTLITAIILYVVGTDTVKGFAVTLTLGIAISMFTAVFCARVIFEIAERRRWLTDLKMMQFVATTNYDFMGIWKPATLASVVLILAGLAATWVRGRDMLDIDFNGGTSAILVLNQERDVDDLRAQLTKELDAQKVQFNLTNIAVAGEEAATYKGRVYKIDTSIATVKDLQSKLLETLKDDKGVSLLQTYSVSFDAPKAVEVASTTTFPPTSTDAPAVDADKPQADAKQPEAPKVELPKTETPKENVTPEKSKTEAPPATEEKNEDKKDEKKSDESKVENKKADEKKVDDAKPDANKSSRRLNGFENLVAFAEDAAKAVAEKEKDAADAKKSDADAKTDPAKAESPKTEPAAKEPPAAEKSAAEKPSAEKSADAPKAEAPKTSEPAAPANPPSTESSAAATEPAQPKPAEQLSEVTLKFGQKINLATLKGHLEEVSKQFNLPFVDPDLQPTDKDWSGSASKGFTEWKLKARLAPSDLEKVLAKVQTDLQSTPVFLTSSEIGPQVAGDTQLTAIYALVASLIGIILYIWFRFSRIVWGVAAVIALIHDVLMMLAAIAISKWLAPFLGIVLIDEFKINLVVVAAFLTLVGYSINDTIVTFDRLREVRGKSPNLTVEMINLSINQTLSRTILTALTVFMVVVILYVLGGPSIHGFAFAMLVGTIVGCYSSIFIAAPIVLWMSQSSQSINVPTETTSSSANQR